MDTKIDVVIVPLEEALSYASHSMWARLLNNLTPDKALRVRVKTKKECRIMQRRVNIVANRMRYKIKTKGKEVGDGWLLYIWEKETEPAAILEG